MLDENLPTFVLKSSTDKPKQNSTFLYSRHGADFEPFYSLRHLDPEQHASKNRYAIALYDSYNPEVLYGEVLLIPEWTQPTLSQDAIRANGGVPPPPEPILPTEFVIQLYNPDQQIAVRYKPAGLTSTASWEFEIPQQTFRTPSTSTLDRSQNDPGAYEFTPRVALKWKKDGRLSKDLACYLSGKTTNPDGSKKKHREPDITIAILKNLKEVTLYEPNMARVEIEDLKGFEVVILLGAVVIRDVYFGSMKDTFNLNLTSPTITPAVVVPGSTPNSLPLRPVQPARDPRVPPTDPRTQWELDAEASRLQRQTAEEERQRNRRDEAEQKRIKKMLDTEEKERRKKEIEVEKETERLRKLYGKEDSSVRPALPGRPPPRPASSNQVDPRQSGGGHLTPQPYHYQPGPWGGPVGTGNPYISGAANQSTFLHPQQHQLKQKSSIFGFRRNSDQDGSRLQKKRSSIW